MRSYLENLKNELQQCGNPIAAAAVDDALSHFQKRLWHELSLDLLTLIRDPVMLSKALDLYEGVVLAIRADISPVVYVQLVHFVCVSPVSTTEKALNLVEGACASLINNRSEQGQYAALCIRALLLLESTSAEESAHLAAIPGSPPHTARKILEQTETYMHGLKMHEIEPVLVALYGMARGRDYEIRRQYTSFYANAFDIILYSGKAQLTIRDEDVTSLAYKTVVAGLLSDKLFNYGKLLNFQPFVNQLSSPSCTKQWALELMKLCNDGAVTDFEAYFATHQAEIQAEPVIAAAAATLQYKVRLMALLHMVFYTPLNERTFTFATIAERCKVGEDDAEPLLLEALAHGIIKGRMDGLKREAHITWVEPRVLSLEEVKALAQHVAKWRTQVTGLTESVSKMTAQISH